jgi:hypothetical protein
MHGVIIESCPHGLSSLFDKSREMLAVISGGANAARRGRTETRHGLFFFLLRSQPLSSPHLYCYAAVCYVYNLN